jgi:1,4-dihydroxy-2-naphthoate octaprenyltransferase
MPVYCLLALLTIPLAAKAMQGSREHGDRDRLVQALGQNVKFILFTQVLLGAGYILEKVIPL